MNDNTCYIIDTDPGTDDFIALLAFESLIKNKDKYYISSIGNVSQKQAHINLFGLKSLIKKDIKIYKGKESVTNSKEIYELIDGYHGKYGLAGINLENLIVSKEEKDLCNLYEDTKKYDNIIYLAIAPLTNLLSLTKSYPDLSRKIKSLIIMGGGFNEYNTPNDTEFNFHADPIAVKSIFQSNLSIKLIPLDTTQQIQLTDEEISYIEDIPQKSNKKNEIYSILKKLLKFNRDSARKHNLNGPVIHDLFTVLSNIGDIHHDKQKIKVDIDEYGKIFKSKNGKEITWLNNFDRKKYVEYLKNIFINTYNI